MRFTRYSSDGNAVIQERIKLSPQPGEHNAPLAKVKPVETNSLDDGGAGARFASRCRVLAGIEELLRSTAIPA